jgi:hypothetical protein
VCEKWSVLTRARQKHIPFLFGFDKPFVVVYPLDSHEVTILTLLLFNANRPTHPCLKGGDTVRFDCKKGRKKFDNVSQDYLRVEIAATAKK